MSDENQPEIDLQVTDMGAQARPRKLKAVGSVQDQIDFLEAWGGGHEGIARSAVDRLAALARGEPDPGPWIVEPKPDTHVAIVERMAYEMRQEIDQEIRDAQQAAERG